MQTVELLTAIRHHSKARLALSSMKDAIRAAGDTVVQTDSYQGKCDWLMLWGVGARAHHEARNAHRAKGRHALLLDMGYTNREASWRFSIDDDHPHRLLDATPTDLPMVGALKNTFDPNGHIVIVGMGIKSKRYLGIHHWERTTYKDLKAEFPRRRIVIKEKTDATPFENFLNGAALVVARHSNCCVDAAIHNVPFRCIDGAAYWLKDLRDRETFLRKLAHWQSTPEQAGQAWRFIKQTARSN